MGRSALWVDFYDVKGDMEALFWPAAIEAEPARTRHCIPGNQR